MTSSTSAPAALLPLLLLLAAAAADVVALLSPPAVSRRPLRPQRRSERGSTDPKRRSSPGCRFPTAAADDASSGGEGAAGSSIAADLASTTAAASEAESDLPVDRPRRRWRRRRRKDASVASVVASAAAKPEPRPTEAETDTEPSKCPLFSATFPRHRVEISSAFSAEESERRRRRRARRGIIAKSAGGKGIQIGSGSGKGDNNRSDGNTKPNDGGGPWGMLSGALSRVFDPDASSMGGAGTILGAAARGKVESLYRQERARGAFRWADAPPTEEEGTASDAPLRDEDLASAASFWRAAADLARERRGDERDDVESGRHLYLALPETTATVARSLCDVLNWHDDRMTSRSDEGRGGGGGGGRIRAELDPRVDAVPVVRFACVGHTDEGGERQQQRPQPSRLDEERDPLPDAQTTERRTKAWARRVLVDLRICPFTKSDAKSGQGLGDLGVPVANILYRHSEARAEEEGGESAYSLMADTWEAISDMVAAGPSGKSGVSSILLSAPGYDEDFAQWSGPVFAMLEACVGAVQAEEMVGVVCFHPRYVTPDGRSWPGFGHMHSLPRLKQWYERHPPEGSTSSPCPLSDDEIAAGGAWQRRTPHAVINVLRAEQLEAAEGRRKTGELYARNVRVLVGRGEDGGGGGVGLERLAEDLERERCL